jgi:ABC-type glycerol-3-phosphate transport system substrate-binding protein
MKKRMLSIALAVLMLTGCAGKKSSSLTATPAAEMLSLKAADISMSGYFEDITDISSDPVSGKILVFGRLANGCYSGYLTDHTFADYEEFRFKPQEGETVKYAALLRSGRKAVLTLLGGTTYIHIYDRDNALEKAIDCGELLGEDDYATLIAGENSIIIDQSIQYNRELTVISDSESKVLGKVKLDADIYVGCAADKDGVPTVVYSTLEKGCTAHIDGTELVDETECGKLSASAYSMCAGFGDYTLVANLGTSLVGLKDGEWVELTNNMDSSVEFYGMNSMVMTAEDEFAAVKYGDARSKLILLSAQDVSNLKTKQVVTIASFNQGGGSLGQFDDEIKAFNAENENYRIEYRNYWDSDKNERDYDKLRLDIISGDGPDIIPFDAYFTVDSFSSGVFCDLYEFIDKEPSLKREDFLPNVRKAFERDGKMVMVTPTFFNYMTVTAKSGYAGVCENWSFDDMIAAYNAKPEDMYFFEPFEDTTPRYAIFKDVVLSQFFIDYDKAKCWFDSPEYIKMLKFFSGNKIGMTEDEYKHKERDNRTVFVQDDILNGETFIEFINGDCFGFLSLYEKVRYDYEDDCVFVGYPYDGKESGSFIALDTYLGIVANSPHKDGAWSFLRYMLSDDYYKTPNNYGKFSTIESRFDEAAQQSVDGFLEFQFDENGNLIEGDMVKWNWELPVVEWDGKDFVDKGKVKLEPFTQEECDYYKNMIKNSHVIRYDGNISDIVTEEIMSFFNYECTAEECAERIQDRASIYLSERYG